MRTSHALSLIAAALITVPATAQQDRFAEVERRLAQIDRDEDGRFTPDEIAAFPAAARLLDVPAMDSDGDGALTLAEVRAGLLAKRQRGELRRPTNEAVRTITVDGREREYILDVPRSAEGDLPVVFVFHGGGGRGANVATMFDGLYDRDGFIAVYPSGVNGNWNDGRNAARIESQRQAVDDVAFVRALLDEIDRDHAVDRGRVFATGVSNGGIFSHRLAAEAADVFAAVAPVIGGLAEPLAESFAPSAPISLLVIQSDADPLVPIKGGTIGNSDRGGAIIATDAMLIKYLAHNGIDAEPKVEPLPDNDPHDGTTTLRYEYPPGRDGVLVEHLLVRGGGHTVPGRRLDREQNQPARAERVGKTSRDFDALDAIWAFFSRCPSKPATTPQTNDAGEPK